MLINSYRFASAGPTDPNFANVSLLLHGNGTNGSTTITDSSPSPKTVTPVGNAQISTAIADPFGNSTRGVLALDGTGDAIETSASLSLAYGSDDFTIETWAYFNTLDGSTTVARLSSGSSFDGILFVHGASSGNAGLYITSSGTAWDIFANAAAFTGLTTNTWIHLALSRNGSNFKTFVNGSQVISFTSLSSIRQLSNIARIGAANPSGQVAMNGYIDDFRITKGVARYTTNFAGSLPTAPFPDS